MNIDELRKSLYDTYVTWYSELSADPIIAAPDISLPYFIYLPDNWTESPTRILIVGEEGFGEVGCDRDKRKTQFNIIETIQDFNRYCLSDKTLNRRPFWRRINYLKSVFPDASFCWTNLDKVHRLKAKDSKSGCKLLTSQRKALHNYPILADEIKIIHPTHVIFFGWYGYSLEKEFSDFDKTIYDNLYKNGNDGWKLDGYCTPILSADNVQYIFTYHPGWCTRYNHENDVRIKIKNVILNPQTIDGNKPLN